MATSHVVSKLLDHQVILLGTYDLRMILIAIGPSQLKQLQALQGRGIVSRRRSELVSKGTQHHDSRATGFAVSFELHV